MVSRFHGADEYALRLVRFKARQLVGRYGLGWSDVPDLEQDMLVELVRRFDRYDPSRSKPTTFIIQVVDNAIADIVDSRKAGVRDYRLTELSLDRPMPRGDGKSSTTSKDHIDEDDYMRRTCGCSAPGQLLLEATTDISALLQKLPEELWQVCMAIINDTSFSKLATELGVHRSTIYERKRALRKAFEKEGFADYFEKQSDNS